MLDTEGIGSNPMRNLLLTRALERGATLIRYADDDDVITGVRPEDTQPGALTYWGYT